MKTTLMAAACAALLVPAMASALTLDVASLTCKDMANMSDTDVEKLLFWMDGYMGGAAQDSNYDQERLQANVKAATEACAANMDATLMEVLDAAENG